jgi:cytidyltransferase-like protein
MSIVVVSGSFDDLKAKNVRFLEEASRLGEVTVVLWSDKTFEAIHGRTPKFPEAERAYLLQAMRFVKNVTRQNETADPDRLQADNGIKPDFWAVEQTQDNERKRSFCKSAGISYRVIAERDLQGFSIAPFCGGEETTSREKVLVTGCYDWFHSGHVRFFEEVSGLGDLYVVLGSDRNVRLLKGEGHPMFSENERRYLVQAVRYVKQTFISSGNGWMDAEPEIAVIKPDIYAVNEDGDKPEKRQFCEKHNLRYVVLKRTPKEGLPRRQSTNLRGF